ncbi:hypothetical protein X747_05385 [Mesorhizobium sp. LNJC384A00]|nr:hypothetical protein X747_05385 [Mesorhizobium sp. LNJC384A00]
MNEVEILLTIIYNVMRLMVDSETDDLIGYVSCEAASRLRMKHPVRDFASLSSDYAHGEW